MKSQLEYYASNLCYNDPQCYPGTFLQMSGLRVVYDVAPDNANTNNRVTTFDMPCEGDPTNWCPIDLDTIYYIALPSFLAEGGTRTTYFPDYILNRTIGPVDNQAFGKFIGDNSPITQRVEGRITINYYDDPLPTTESGMSSTEAGMSSTEEGMSSTEEGMSSSPSGNMSSTVSSPTEEPTTPKDDGENSATSLIWMHSILISVAFYLFTEL